MTVILLSCLGHLIKYDCLKVNFATCNKKTSMCKFINTRAFVSNITRDCVLTQCIPGRDIVKA